MREPVFRLGRYVALAAAIWVLAATAAQAQHLVLPPGGHFIDVVVNGTPLRLKVRLDQEMAITLNRDAAARAGLGEGEGSTRMDIGPVRIKGRSGSAPMTIDGRPVRASFSWYDRDPQSGADGVISASLLPFESVTLESGPPREQARIVALATRLDTNHGIHVPLRMRRRTLAARVSLEHERTTALSAAAAVILAELGGRIEAERTEVEIAFGVTRPARRLRLDRPLMVGELSIADLLVRWTDFSGGNRLPPAQRAEADAAILVSGRSPRQQSVYRLTIGADVIGGCWSATYSRADQSLVLRCAP